MKDYKKTLERLDSGAYKNSREIALGGQTFSVRDVFVKAPLISGLNVYFVGGTGEGKSQLCYDLKGYMGDGYCYMEGRNDFEPSELLRHLRLDKLSHPETIKTDSELIELTDNVNKVLYYVEELTRCKEIVQNYFFNFFDGKIQFMGDIRPLGRYGYSLGFASGNIGNGNYIGVSDSDRALNDRMHLIVNFDYPDFRPTPLDKFKIFSSKKDPRATLSEKTDDCLEDIISLHNEFKQREVPSIIYLLGVYLNEGLDYLENTKKHSKRAVASRWPHVNGIRKDTDESKIFPVSTRSVFGAIALSQSLELIAELRGNQIQDSVPLFLDCLRFTIPYSGVLAKDFVDRDCDGDAYEAFDSILGKGSLTQTDARNREQIMTKLPYLESALMFAQKGITYSSLLDGIANETEGKWRAVRNAVKDYADEISQNPEKAKEKMKLEEVIKKAKEVNVK